jgi:hypothetical protein
MKRRQAAGSGPGSMRHFHLVLAGVLAALLSLVGLADVAEASTSPDSVSSLLVPYLHRTCVAPPERLAALLGSGGIRMAAAASPAAASTTTASGAYDRLAHTFAATSAGLELASASADVPSEETPSTVATALAAEDVPTVVFSRSRAPGIAQNFDDAVENGAPTRLNRVGSAARVWTLT